MTSGEPAELADMSRETFPAAPQLEPGRPGALKCQEQDKSIPAAHHKRPYITALLAQSAIDENISRIRDYSIRTKCFT